MAVDVSALLTAVTDVVIGMSIAQRGFLIYGRGHDIGERGAERAAAALARALQLQAPIELRFSPQTVYLGGRSLGRTHPVLRGFSERLWRRGIAGLTFHQGAGLAGIVALLSSLTEAVRHRASREETEKLLRENRPERIDVLFLRQLLTHEVRDEVEALSPEEARKQWESLMSQLAALDMGGSLAPLGGTFEGSFTPGTEAARGGGGASSGPTRQLDYAGAVVNYLKRWQQTRRSDEMLQTSEVGKKVGSLVAGINPDLKRQIVSAAVRAPDVNSETLHSFIHMTGKEALLESLRRINDAGQTISATAHQTLSMLALTAAEGKAPAGATIAGAPAAAADLFGDELQSLLDSMVSDAQGDSYTSEELSHVLVQAEQSAGRFVVGDKRDDSVVTTEEGEQHFLFCARELHRSQPLDKELAATVCRESQRAYLRLLESGTARGWEEAMDLARESGQAGGHPADVPWVWEQEDVLERLRQRMTEAGRWEAESSVEQLVAIGDVAVPLLVEVLATSDSMSVRRRALQGLEEISGNPTDVLVPLLEPAQPWYLHRNAIYVLRKRNDPAGAAAAKALWKKADPRVRMEIVLYLLAVGDENRMEHLEEALADRDLDYALGVARAVLKNPTRDVITGVVRRAELITGDLVGSPFHIALLRALASTRQPQALHYVAEVPARRLPLLPWQRKRFRREIEAMVSRS